MPKRKTKSIDIVFESGTPMEWSDRFIRKSGKWYYVGITTVWDVTPIVKGGVIAYKDWDKYHFVALVKDDIV